jgi:hypothetical protein
VLLAVGLEGHLETGARLDGVQPGPQRRCQALFLQERRAQLEQQQPCFGKRLACGLANVLQIRGHGRSVTVRQGALGCFRVQRIPYSA